MLTFKTLSPAQQELVRLMQRINYGEIRRLPVSKGEPVLNPLPVTVRAVKFGAENGVRSQASLKDFALKEQVVQFLEEISNICDGEIETVEVKAGLPFMAMIRA